MFSSISKVSPEEVEKQLTQEKPLKIVDVRTEKEVQNGMIPGALHIPLHELPERMHELDPSEEYVMVCRSGNRSTKAAKQMEKQGFNVKNMSGGMLKWQGEIKA